MLSLEHAAGREDGLMPCIGLWCGHLLSTRTCVWVLYLKPAKEVVDVGGVLPLLQSDVSCNFIGCQDVRLIL